MLSSGVFQMDKLLNQDFTKPPDIKVGCNIPQALFNRSAGHTQNVPKELQFIAEEALIMKKHQEFVRFCSYFSPYLLWNKF